MINYFFKTYGCQANVADSEGIAKFLDEIGCQGVDSPPEADIVIVNTCAVRDKAEQKLFSYLGRLAEDKAAKRYMKIGIIGCVASYKKKELYKRFDHVNFVYGARDEMETFKAYLSDVIVKLETTKQLYESDTSKKVASGGQDRDVKKVVASKGLLSKMGRSASFLRKNVAELTKTKKAPEVNRSFINIMTGCNKYCAYCIVPFTRGREVSYPMDDLVMRVEHDVRGGAKEVTLIGQNVNSYKDPESGHDFSELLRRVAKIDGQFWVRWVSPHPQDMTEELFDVIAAHPDRIPPYVHFPAQSGSDRVLGLMKRNYTVEQYLEQIGWLRDRMPDATISTDIIVGFPGETKEEYEQTRALIEKVGYDWIYSFIYSPRNYTPALKMHDDAMTKEEKTACLMELQKLQKDISLQCNEKHIGHERLVLVEKKLENGKLLARTKGNLRVLFDGDEKLVGEFINIAIISASPANLIGKLI